MPPQPQLAETPHRDRIRQARDWGSINWHPAWQPGGAAQRQGPRESFERFCTLLPHPWAPSAAISAGVLFLIQITGWERLVQALSALIKAAVNRPPQQHRRADSSTMPKARVLLKLLICNSSAAAVCNARRKLLRITASAKVNTCLCLYRDSQLLTCPPTLVWFVPLGGVVL